MMFHLAQINIGRILATPDHPIMADFFAGLDEINALAEKSEGFIWRLKGDGNDATSLRIFNDDFTLVNMSVWKDIDTLYHFAYQTAHKEYVKRRKEWFEKMKDMYMAMWYVAEGHTPDVAEAEQRLIYLRANGETPYAFTFRKRFDPADALAYRPRL